MNNAFSSVVFQYFSRSFLILLLSVTRELWFAVIKPWSFNVAVPAAAPPLYQKFGITHILWQDFIMTVYFAALFLI